MNDNDLFVDSDAYFNKPDRYQNDGDIPEEFRVDYVPVDVFSGYVPVKGKKSDQETIEEAQKSIRKRFSLGS